MARKMKTGPRARWADEYRAARAAARFYAGMSVSRGIKVTSMFETMDLCPGFEFCRLHGDSLYAPVGHLGLVTHNARMWDLRRRVRLPG